MDEKNVTRISVIHFLELPVHQSIIFFIFFLFLIIYFVTICGNLLIILLVSYSNSLHSPMYFFLSQLSISDILLVTDIIPNVLHVVLVKDTIMSFPHCITQFYFLALPGCLECFLLTVMSYDRYLAICKPLHYIMIMSHQFCLIMIVTCWTLSILITLIVPLTILKLQFCGPNIIDHFFCDLDPILKLSCTNTIVVQLQVMSISAAFIVIPFFIIIVSYVYIIVTIFEITSITGRQKVFSTCSSHLTVVCIYYGTLICVYLLPTRVQTLYITKFLSLLYTVVTPLLNPIIYSLRNKDLLNVVGIVISKLLDLHSRNIKMWS